MEKAPFSCYFFIDFNALECYNIPDIDMIHLRVERTNAKKI